MKDLRKDVIEQLNEAHPRAADLYAAAIEITEGTELCVALLGAMAIHFALDHDFKDEMDAVEHIALFARALHAQHKNVRELFERALQEHEEGRGPIH